VTFAPRAGAGPLFRSVAGVIATAVLLAMFALPVAADGGQVKLSRPAVSPDRGTTDTTFTFTVNYRDRSDTPPQSVRVVIGGTAHAMAADGDRWKKGETFSVQMTLPAGEHDVLFAATDAGGNDVTIDGGRVRIHAPSAPKPEPTPEPPPNVAKPDPDPTPAPVQTTAPKPRLSPAAVQTAAPKPRTTPAPPPAVVTAPTATPDATEPASSGTGAPPAGIGAPPAGIGAPPAGIGAPPAGPASPEGPAPGDPAASDDRGAGEATAGLPGSWGDLTRYLEALGLDPAGSPFVRLIPVMIWTSGGVALAMAFGIFGKRRRDGEPPEPDEVLSAKAARGSGQAATAALVPDVITRPAPYDAEAAMPRWRRPSLLQARKADPLRDGAAAARLSFDHSAVAPIEGLERRLIRYLVVQLLDTPDEFRGTAIGSLAQGDEVQLLERSGTYWRILSPDGQQGWIHRMTLGDVVGLPAAPTARETWATTSIEAEDVDEDVLVAFMTARGRA
jgi:hypothetical protein